MRWCCSWSVWSTIHKYFNLGYHEVVFVVSTGRGERMRKCGIILVHVLEY